MYINNLGTVTLVNIYGIYVSPSMLLLTVVVGSKYEMKMIINLISYITFKIKK